MQTHEFLSDTVLLFYYITFSLSLIITAAVVFQCLHFPRRENVVASSFVHEEKEYRSRLLRIGTATAVNGDEKK